MIKLLLLCLLACMPQTKWLIYINNVNKFTINYPDKWEKSNNGNAIVFLSPAENSKDLFQENVNLILQDVSQKETNLEQYTALTKKQIVENLGTSAIISLKNTVLAGQQAKEIIYDMNYKGKNLKIKQYWFIKDNLAYLFTYTAEPKQYSKYESVAIEMINSFKFIK